jgi:dTMP kinase
MTTRGRLFVLEGIDGVGKTTQADRLADHLRALGREVIRSREPTDGPHGAALRRSMTLGRLSPEQELQLFLDDRLDHVQTLIQPALDRGADVVLDRYYFSTVAYQGARGFDPDALLARNEAFAPPPDLLLIFDLPVPESLRRIQHSRGAAPDAFEVPALLARSRQIFLDLARRLPYARVIDAAQPLQAVTDDMIRALAQASPTA